MKKIKFKMRCKPSDSIVLQKRNSILFVSDFNDEDAQLIGDSPVVGEANANPDDVTDLVTTLPPNVEE